MPSLVWFNHTRASKGYSLIEIDPANLDSEIERLREMAGGRSINAENLHSIFGPRGSQGRLPSSHAGASRTENTPVTMLVPNGDEDIKFRPLDEAPGLFLEMANLTCDANSVLEFACRYGRLDPRQTSQFVAGPDWDLVVANWFGCIEQYRKKVELWEKAKDSGDYAEVTNAINEELPHIDFQVGAIPIPGMEKPDVRMVVKDLIGAMALQFAQAVSSATSFRKCAWCPHWFAYGTGTGRRQSAHYCSPACQKAAWFHENERRKQRQITKKRTAKHA